MHQEHLYTCAHLCVSAWCVCTMCACIHRPVKTERRIRCWFLMDGGGGALPAAGKAVAHKRLTCTGWTAGQRCAHRRLGHSQFCRVSGRAGARRGVERAGLRELTHATFSHGLQGSWPLGELHLRRTLIIPSPLCSSHCPGRDRKEGAKSETGWATGRTPVRTREEQEHGLSRPPGASSHRRLAPHRSL